MPKVTWINLNKTIEVNKGTSILDAALDNNIELEHSCGGCCACTTCRVIVREGIQNLSTPEEDEEDLLERIIEFTPEEKKKVRLGCQSKIHGDITLEIPK